MEIVKDMFVDLSDILSTEIFFNLCEEQNINWRSGRKPRERKIYLGYIVIIEYDSGFLELRSATLEYTNKNKLIKFSITD
jgi:hypothetical protein